MIAAADMFGAEGTDGAGQNVKDAYEYEQAREAWLARYEGDKDRAEAELRPMVDQGDTDAADHLGMFHLEHGDEEEALALLHWAAEAGNPIAAYTLAGHLPHDEAERFYEIASRAGHVPANTEMGVRGLARGESEFGERLLVLAAGQGSVRAMSHLGVVVAARGETEAAKELWSCAATSGWGEAARHLAGACRAEGDAEGAEHWEVMAEMGSYAGPERMMRPPPYARLRLSRLREELGQD